MDVTIIQDNARSHRSGRSAIRLCDPHNGVRRRHRRRCSGHITYNKHPEVCQDEQEVTEPTLCSRWDSASNTKTGNDELKTPRRCHTRDSDSESSYYDDERELFFTPPRHTNNTEKNQTNQSWTGSDCVGKREKETLLGDVPHHEGSLSLVGGVAAQHRKNRAMIVQRSRLPKVERASSL